MELWEAPLKSPKTSLALGFVAWKTFFLAIALTSPGLGYDTSTTLLYPSGQDLSTSLVRWDAVYLTEIARRGYLFEQDWAFSWGFTHLTTGFAALLRYFEIIQGPSVEAWAGIVISHISHLLSVIWLYYLSSLLFQSHPRGASIALISASLHVISPAGLFLSAPYSESLFSAIQFGGYYLYAKGCKPQGESFTVKRTVTLLISGVVFGLGATVRSNGVLSGIPYAYDAFATCVELIRDSFSVANIRQLVIIVLAGSFIAIGAVIPQAVAYQEYCSSDLDFSEIRSWCTSFVPSIYTFVQSHYWGVGFLRYWTISNIPLFLLAVPMLSIMAKSCQWALIDEPMTVPQLPSGENHQMNTRPQSIPADPRDLTKLLRLIALPQAALAAMTLFNSHVQIVTRLSSAHPVWYWWLATLLVEGGESGVRIGRADIACRWMVIYAIIQGGLFSSFLPPA